MSAAPAFLLTDLDSPDADDTGPGLAHSTPAPPLSRALSRMQRWCEQQKDQANFNARGALLPSIEDIATQIRAYFPAHIDVSAFAKALMDDFTRPGKGARNGAIELSIEYVGEGKKVSENALKTQANRRSLVKWYAAKEVLGSDYSTLANTLRPTGSGGEASGEDLLKHVTRANKKGFLLVARTVDAADMRDRAMAAVSFNSTATGGIVAGVGAGGVVAGAIVPAVIVPFIERAQALAATLDQAPTSPRALPALAALAVQARAIESALASPSLRSHTPLPSPVATLLKDAGVKAGAFALAGALSEIVRTLPPDAPTLARETAAAIRSLDVAARKDGLDMRGALARTLAADPAFHGAVAMPGPYAPARAVAALLAKPETLPVLERALPPQSAALVRAALIVPALESAARAPVSIEAVADGLTHAAARSGEPTLKAAAQVLEKASAMPRAQKEDMIETVIANVNALSLRANRPSPPTGDLAAAAAQTALLQPSAPYTPPAPARDAGLLQPLPPNAPLAMLARAAAVPVPPAVAPPAPAITALSAEAGNLKAGQTPGSDKKNEGSGPCGNCKKGFNCAACSVLSNAALARLDRAMDKSFLVERKKTLKVT